MNLEEAHSFRAHSNASAFLTTRSNVSSDSSSANSLLPRQSFRTGVGKRFRLLGHFRESRKRTRLEKTRFPRKDTFIKIYDNAKIIKMEWPQSCNPESRGTF